ncbi:hypothetical protein [Paenibacillus hamazuiensis]|uniref:hypothetical protein n=1 Tax=Paenibacillus hamazuiensis TaxID=2936508 RepID=UPI00200E3C85|nr:hypothetical protein [Paenibacillus hamazuiensis]
MPALFNRLFLRKREILIDNRLISFQILGQKSKKLEIWCENERVKEILTKMPYSHFVVETFQAYKQESGLNYRYVLIADNMKESDNWYYRKGRTWIVTLKFVLELILGVLSLQKIDAEPLERFIIHEVA